MDTEQAMSDETVGFAREVVARFNRRDVAGLIELITDDFEWGTWTSTGGADTLYRGADGLAGYFRDADVWEVLNLEVHEFRDFGDDVFVAGTFHLRGEGSGAEVHAPWFSAFFISGGRLSRVLSYRTEAEALEALGLSA
jgi:ketosteroid isomerase-like protein